MIRVGITTDRYGQVAPHFEAVGLTPVPTACVRMEPASDSEIDDARISVSNSDLALITSARTVSLLWPDGDMPAIDVAAVGESTARSVTAAGGHVVIVGTGGLGGLVDMLVDRVEGLRVKLVHAAGADELAVERLRSLAPGLEELIVYRMVPVGPPATLVEAVVFGSPSAVEGWHINRRLAGLVTGVIGATTAEAIDRYRKPDVVAPRPSFRALATAMGSFLEVNV